MKIAFVRGSSLLISPRSYNIQEVGLAKALINYNISSDVFIASSLKELSSTTLTKKNDHEARLFLLPCKKLPGRQGYYPGLLKQLEKGKYDLIQIHEDSQITSLIVANWARRRNIPTILCQGMYRNYQQLLPRISQTVYDQIALRLLRKCVKACIAKTTRAQNYLKKKGFENIFVCPVGLDVTNFGIDHPVDWKGKYKIPANAKILLYVGTIEQRRNTLFLISLFQKLLRKRSDLYLLIAGDGSDKTACIALVEKLLLHKRVIFLEKVPQEHLSSLYNVADIFLLPSNYEIYGMVILEAMYFGLPVLSSHTAGAEEIIENNENGILIPEIDEYAWLKVIMELLSDSERVARIKVNAHKRIVENFTWEIAAQKYYKTYMGALSNRISI